MGALNFFKIYVELLTAVFVNLIYTSVTHTKNFFFRPLVNWLCKKLAALNFLFYMNIFEFLKSWASNTIVTNDTDKTKTYQQLNVKKRSGTELTSGEIEMRFSFNTRYGTHKVTRLGEVPNFVRLGDDIFHLKWDPAWTEITEGVWSKLGGSYTSKEYFVKFSPHRLPAYINVTYCDTYECESYEFNHHDQETFEVLVEKPEDV